MKKVAFRPVGEQLQSVAKYASTYNKLLFFLLLAVVYGFVVVRINVLSQAEPNPDDVSAQIVGGKSLKVDPTVVDKIQKLQDNSVSVQSLFDQARQNPFRE